MNELIAADRVYEWEILLDNWIFLAAIALFLVEIVRYVAKRSLRWDIVADAIVNFVTLFGYLFVSYVALATVYLYAYYTVYEYRLFDVPITLWSIGICVVLADLAYYWEHRFTHRVGIGWATHTVHHSSPYFNISVAYRFGPLDGVFPIPFNLPIVLIGFDPLVVFFAEAFVQLYQTLLHTEAIGKLPRPIEAVMNTPSHHRVHHGRNEQYLDKNYGGVFIVWDRIFRTFEEEREKVVFGVNPPIETVNPLKVWFHGFVRMYKKGPRALWLPP